MAHKRLQEKKRVSTPSAASAPRRPAAAPQWRLPAFLTGPAWPYLLLAAMTLVFFFDMFFGGKSFLMRDVFCDCLPWRRFARLALLSGHLPLWNPYSMCGQPYIANPQTAVFYPLHAVFYIFPVLFGLKLWMALHLLIAAAGMYALARHWKLEEGPALLAGVSYGFSAYVIAQLEFQSAVPSIVGCPLAVLLVSKMMDAAQEPVAEGGRGWLARIRRLTPVTAALTLLYAAEFLAGHQQSFINALFIALLYMAGRGIAGRSLAAVMRAGAAFAAAGLLTIGLCLPQLLLTLELMPMSIRSGTFDPGLNNASFHPIWALTWLLPFLGGRAGHNGQWWAETHGLFEFWAGAVYIGVPALIFMGASLAWLWRRGEDRNGAFTRRALTLTLLGIFAFGMLMSLGKYTPLYMFFYNHVPVFNKLRWPSKFLHLVVFATAGLAGLGFQAFLESGENGARARLRRWLPAAWLGVFALMAALTLVATGHPGFFTWLTAGAYQHNPDAPERFAGLVQDWELALLFLGLSLAALLPFVMGWARGRARLAAQVGVALAAFINLCVIGRQIHPIADDQIYLLQPDETMVRLSRQEPCRVGSRYMNIMQFELYGVTNPEIYRMAAMGMVGENALPHEVFRIHGGDVLKLGPIMHLFDMAYAKNAATETKERCLGLVNMRWILHGPPLQDVMAGKMPDQLGVAEMKKSRPRALVMENWRVVQSEAETTQTLLSPKHDIYRMALLNQAPEGWPAQNIAGPLAPDQPITTLAQAGVESIQYGWNRVELTATAKRPSVLVLGDVDYPGWQAFVDGKREPVLRADLIFRAVKLEPGRHTVSFVYRPGRFSAGMAVSLATLLLIGGATLAGPVRRRLASRRPEPEKGAAAAGEA